MRFVMPVAVVAVLGVVVKATWPDIARYLKMRKM